MYTISEQLQTSIFYQRVNLLKNNFIEKTEYKKNINHVIPCEDHIHNIFIGDTYVANFTEYHNRIDRTLLVNIDELKLCTLAIPVSLEEVTVFSYGGEILPLSNELFIFNGCCANRYCFNDLIRIDKIASSNRVIIGHDSMKFNYILHNDRRVIC